jgi:hypothetical protein
MAIEYKETYLWPKGQMMCLVLQGLVAQPEKDRDPIGPLVAVAYSHGQLLVAVAVASILVKVRTGKNRLQPVATGFLSIFKPT